jgi:hypothetical protein
LNYEWKIEGVTVNDDLITGAKYYCKATDRGFSVDTEGTWTIKDPKTALPMGDVTEEMVIDWIKGQTEGQVEKRLAEQVANLKAATPLSVPWNPPVFTPTFEE